MSFQKSNYLYLITILFFAIGFFNIIFAWIGFLCMIIPMVLLIKDKNKTWCQGICPRSNLFNKLFQGRSLTGRAAPNWLTRGKVKWFVFAYFCINLFVLTMSTIMVFKGRIEPMEYVRFLIVFKLPWEMPQFVNLGTFPDWAVHLSFRIYSMMFTTTIIGLLLGWIYRPRTWCAVCPISTVSGMVLKKTKS